MADPEGALTSDTGEGRQRLRPDCCPSERPNAVETADPCTRSPRAQCCTQDGFSTLGLGAQH